MTQQRSTTPQSSDRVRCHIHVVSRSEFLRIWKTSGYSTESSNVLDSGLTSFIEEPKTFATEAAFLAEHARLEQLVKAVAPSASVETLYYAAGEEIPRYSRNS